MKKLAILCGFVLFASGAATAQADVQGDAEAGQSKSVTCAACHGQTGTSPSGDFPNIGGQGYKYLVKQLMDYRLGAQTNGAEGRNNMLMASQVVNLSDQDIHDLAAFYASQEHPVGTVDEEIVEEAQRLFMGGDLDRGITACAACHGPSGLGMGLAAFPLLSGQHAEYTALTLKEFRSGDRSNDPNGMMRDIAARLTDRDIEILSKYIRGLY
ncbi:c-type cytochrome [Aliidiomarina haloalkalitolerans]|uniref:Cytochrome c4 n=1 Tax=Aliidiomarina haloalkalitolerans TaxID=859059 RepID=A0A432VS88_9GAMM|nr:c-type cytochrome [Aliidiomarina haloalkalitolerans]RUO19196.1 cytochrome c4 [Aliidiomarina haloalkalitolerans]